MSTIRSATPVRALPTLPGWVSQSAASMNVALPYLIEHGDVIKDGDTFGGSEAERITVRHAMSSHIPGVKILLAGSVHGAG